MRSLSNGLVPYSRCSQLFTGAQMVISDLSSTQETWQVHHRVLQAVHTPFSRALGLLPPRDSPS